MPIDRLTDHIVERLKVIFIKGSFDNRIYESNPWNDYLSYLPFYRDERLITRQIIYCINDDVVFRLNNGSSVYVRN